MKYASAGECTDPVAGSAPADPDHLAVGRHDLGVAVMQCNDLARTKRRGRPTLARAAASIGVVVEVTQLFFIFTTIPVD